MKRLLIAIFLVGFFCVSAFADKFIIPFSCYPKKIQKRYAEYNRKLDLDPNERTKDSWGFIINEGGRYIIVTYKSATEDDFNVIMKIAHEEAKDE